MKKLIFVSCFLLSSIVLARVGTDQGNGGDAVVCAKAGRKTAVLLDYYEADVLRGIKIDLGAGSSTQAKIQVALDRLKVIAPKKAERYAKRIASFNSDAQFLTGQTLPDIPDSQHILVPEDCHIEQLVIQRNPTPPGEKKFLVNKDIWDLLDSTNKAGILLHEAIYENALEFAARNSIATRYFNSKISSSLAEYDTDFRVHCLLVSVGLEYDRSSDGRYQKCYTH